MSAYMICASRESCEPCRSSAAIVFPASTLFHLFMLLPSHRPGYGCRISAMMRSVHAIEHRLHLNYLFSREWAVIVNFPNSYVCCLHVVGGGIEPPLMVAIRCLLHLLQVFTYHCGSRENRTLHGDLQSPFSSKELLERQDFWKKEKILLLIQCLMLPKAPN